MTRPDPITAARHAMVEQLTRDGWLRSPEWIEAFRAVPRHLVAPEVFQATPDGRAFQAIDEQSPDWLQLVYDNSVLTTQLDCDRTRWTGARENGPTQGTATSSSTQPSLMASMLEALDVGDGDRVLELGTGTGYNTALLCHRLGDDSVISVEYDPDVAAWARRALAEQGYHPTLVVGDGATGYPDGGPYDRLLATYSVPSIPYEWITQTRPGGVIVCSIFHDLDVGLMLALTVDEHGSAHGHLLSDEAYFMPSRLHDRLPLDDLLAAAAVAPDGTKRRSRLPGLIPDPAPGWAALTALLTPGLARLTLTRTDGPVQWLLHPDGSWAFHDPQTGQVEQGGPRHLWTRVEEAHELWNRLGRPSRTRIGITVSASVLTVWIDEPDRSIHSRPLRTGGTRSE
ncbi:ATP-grasp peptide maturase system methyltransferase [Pseudonocardia endophytica]|uniref:Protein-L-isoaspartate O-methyltransferase n=1 Tax=Pseudonocardia endophytica TaxID=401976 RepID=A0A4R1HFN1_PSEEN|nr:ATP-grasp peptide maturase system methyltransferase [Pseudonocardia endophytica]TCK20944.1 protein-L-isoaspartate(D-aspartate) O-methyltransferase [Pseudonocardia endophytica]